MLGETISRSSSLRAYSRAPMTMDHSISAVVYISSGQSTVIGMRVGRTPAPGVPYIPAQLLGKADILQTQPIHTGKRTKYLLAPYERGGFAGNGLCKRLVFAGIRGAINEKQVLFGRPDNNVQFPLPA